MMVTLLQPTIHGTYGEGLPLQTPVTLSWGRKQTMEKLALYFGKLNPSGLLALLVSVINGLTGNAFFATPVIPVATLSTLRDRLSAAIEAARTGGRLQKSERDDVVAEVKAALRKVADYVTLTCQGNVTMLISSGYNLAQPRVPVVRVDIPLMRFARGVGNAPGVMDVQWRSVRGAHGYDVWMTDADPNVAANWENIGFTTKVRHSASGLESGKKYWFCVQAVGANSVSGQSVPEFGRAA